MARRDSTRVCQGERTTREGGTDANGSSGSRGNCRHTPRDASRLARVIFDAANRSAGSGAKRLTMASAEAIARIACEPVREIAAFASGTA